MIREIGNTPCWLAVPSSERPGNVEALQALIGPATWYTHPGQAEHYVAGGAESVREVMGYPANVNAALNEGHVKGLPVVLCDDDLQRVRYTPTPSGDATSEVLAFPGAVAMALSYLDAWPGYRLAGAGPTDNAYFGSPGVSTNLFIRRGFWVVKPTDLRLREDMQLKADYDYCLQHWQRYGGMVRCNGLLFSFKQRSNAGGCKALRADESYNERAVRDLLARWPGLVVRHPTRAGEVSLRLPRRRKEVFA